jgi:preprotein translocase subunit YajC
MAIAIYLVVLVLAFFFLIVRPQRRQAAARRLLIAALEVGDEIITAGGIYGTVRALDDEIVTVEVADGVELRIAKGAVNAVAARPVAPDDLDDDGDA